MCALYIYITTHVYIYGRLFTSVSSVNDLRLHLKISITNFVLFFLETTSVYI